MDTISHWTDRLSEYLDGELMPAERDALEAHLDGCPDCRVTLTELRRVIETARTLPDPPLRADRQSDLWAGIAPRLAPRRVPFGARLAALLRPAGGRLTLTVPQLAAAALVLVMGSAAITFVGARLAARHAGGPVLARQGDTTLAVPPDAGGPALLAGLDDPRYAAAVADLEQTLKKHRGQLDPVTVRALEDNLALIDEAVTQSRRALIADPSNPYLSGHLANQMNRKVRVLQRAAMIVAANH